jgi:hypothetical protein
VPDGSFIDKDELLARTHPPAERLADSEGVAPIGHFGLASRTSSFRHCRPRLTSGLMLAGRTAGEKAGVQ